MPEYDFVTMYEPLTGMPVSVPSGEVLSRRNAGYRSEPPKDDTELKPQTLQSFPVSPSATKEAREMIPVDINNGSLKDLSNRLGLSTSQARLVKDRRPYNNLEDLIAKMPEISNWANLEHLLSFDEPEDQKKEAIEQGDTSKADSNEDLTPTGTAKEPLKSLELESKSKK